MSMETNGISQDSRVSEIMSVGLQLRGNTTLDWGYKQMALSVVCTPEMND